MTMLRVVAWLAAVLVIGGAAQAQTAANYPNRPVRIIVGFTPGGPTDVIARIVAQRMSEAWGQQVYVENMAGAGSNTASVAAAKSPPDGYTVLAISTGFMVNASLYAKVPYDAAKDFAPVTMVAYSPNVIVVNPSVPAKTVKELIDEIKTHPGKYSFAGPGIGSTPHLSGELFKLKFGLDLIHIPFGGAGPAIQSTLAGHTPIAFTALPPALQQVKEGKLRALALLATSRVTSLPDLPTMAEAGAPDQEADTLTGIMMPAGTPRAIIDKWQQEIARMVATPDVAEKLAALGFIAVADKPDDFGKRIDSEIKKWGKVIHDAKIPQIQ